MLEYTDSDGGPVNTIMYNVASKVMNPISLPSYTPQVSENYPSATWLVAPNGHWLLGPLNSNQHTVLDTVSHKMVALPRRGSMCYRARWAPDSRGWIEWTPRNSNSGKTAVTVVRLLDSSLDPAPTNGEPCRYRVDRSSLLEWYRGSTVAIAQLVSDHSHRGWSGLGGKFGSSGSPHKWCYNSNNVADQNPRPP